VSSVKLRFEVEGPSGMHRLAILHARSCRTCARALWASMYK
jgi:hypothetical protein